jgi:hypothetical protein
MKVQVLTFTDVQRAALAQIAMTGRVHNEQLLRASMPGSVRLWLPIGGFYSLRYDLTDAGRVARDTGRIEAS